MKERRLSADEAALWARVVATVEPLEGRVVLIAPKHEVAPLVPSEVEGRGITLNEPLKRRSASLGASVKSGREPANTLDGSWDRRLSRGLVQPDFAVDLHGHNLDSAYRTLDAGLDQAIGRGARVLLLVTGKPRDPSSGRGAIRAAVGDWLAASRHADGIAAVRGAHPRHGGPGALYIVLRRARLATS
jgi:DNA-nicking Smr family endonuclease